jgi:ligand-binding sensor domain-containing protein
MFYKKYLILILISFTNIWGYSQKNQTLFHQLTTENGLSNNSITCVFKNSKGFIWIGTIDGLNRYDGYNFTVFKHISSDSLSISDNFISTIVEDSKGNLWIGTQGGGLNKYDPVLNRFTSFFYDIKDSTSLPSNFIFHHNSMLLDNDTLLWIGTNNGLCCLNLKTNKFKRFTLNYQNFPQNTFSDVRIIFDGLNNILWIGTNNGLIKFSKSKGILKVYQHYIGTSNSLCNNIITSIAERNDNNEIWIGTEEGLNIFNPQTETFKHYFSDKLNIGSISDNSITSITKDESGDLWIGTVNNGINLLDIKPKKIGLLKHEPGNLNSLSSNTIRSIYKDKEGILWIGTYGGGLNKYNGRNFVHYLHQPNNPSSLSHNIVSSIYEDSKGELWVGTWGGGLNILNKSNGTFSRIYSGLPDFISDISEDNYGNIWLGCNGGLYIYNTKKSYAYRFDSETNAHDELTASSINKIIRDHNGHIWVATFDGLNKIVLKNKPTATEIPNERKIDITEMMVLIWVNHSIEYDNIIPKIMPIIPPERQMRTDSNRNCPIMSWLVAPTDILIPISRVLSNTVTNIIFIIPIPPMIKDIPAITPKTILKMFFAFCSCFKSSSGTTTLKSLVCECRRRSILFTTELISSKLSLSRTFTIKRSS